MTKIHHYRGYAIDKPEGCTMWNVHEMIGNQIDWCESVAYCKNIKEAKVTIDSIIDEWRLESYKETRIFAQM